MWQIVKCHDSDCCDSFRPSCHFMVITTMWWTWSLIRVNQSNEGTSKDIYTYITLNRILQPNLVPSASLCYAKAKNWMRSRRGHFSQIALVKRLFITLGTLIFRDYYFSRSIEKSPKNCLRKKNFFSGNKVI